MKQVTYINPCIDMKWTTWGKSSKYLEPEKLLNMVSLLMIYPCSDMKWKNWIRPVLILDPHWNYSLDYLFEQQIRFLQLEVMILTM